MLGFHRVDKRMYDLTGLRTGSVRDQFVRAISLTQGLLDDVGEIGRDDKDGLGLLVLGAGVTGAACAITAALLGVRVTVIEKRNKDFLTLSDAKTRRVAPFEYDWPRPGSSSGLEFPDGFPLEFESGLACDLAADWQDEFSHFLGTADGRRIEVLHKRHARRFKYRPSRKPDCVEVEGVWDTQNPNPSTRRFGAVICCTGFMREKVQIDQPTQDEPHPTHPSAPYVGLLKYKGPRFWQDDDSLDQQHFGNTPDKVEAILISGGGDGAMQDLQRALTGLFGEKLYERLVQCLGGKYITDKHLVEILAAEDRARRACAWRMKAPNDAVPHDEMRLWDATFQGIVNEVTDAYADDCRTHNGADRMQAFQQLACALKRQEYGHYDLPPRVVWVTQEPHPGFAYALNRFLALMLKKVMTEGYSTPRLVFRPSTTIERIVRDDPSVACCLKKGDCLGRTHHVKFSGSVQYESFQIIIVRHGLQFLKMPYLGRRASVPEQLVPYAVP